MFAELRDKGERARHASRRLATLSTTIKNKALKAIAEALMEQEPAILIATTTTSTPARKPAWANRCWTACC